MFYRIKKSIFILGLTLLVCSGIYAKNTHEFSHINFIQASSSDDVEKIPDFGENLSSKKQEVKSFPNVESNEPSDEVEKIPE